MVRIAVTERHDDPMHCGDLRAHVVCRRGLTLAFERAGFA
jgi:hypothetical protein